MNNDWLELEGKTVIVTGAASGIGKAVAQEFLNIGANVVISDMAENAPEMDAKEGQLLYVRTDVTKVSDVEASLSGDGTISVTSSVINLTGHKDEFLCRRLAENRCRETGKVVVCTGGVHMDHITGEQIEELLKNIDRMMTE